MSTVCYNQGAFNIYNDLTGKFLLPRGVSKQELIRQVEERRGSALSAVLEARIRRATMRVGVRRIIRGHSSPVRGVGLDALLYTNKEGKNQKALDVQECIEKYLTLEK